MKNFFLPGAIFMLIMGMSNCSSSNNDSSSGITLRSDNQELVDGFNWAKNQALSYAHDGDPVGKWFEAALPGRDAFCMRDVSHQAYGALLLGLDDHLRNMMFKFAVNISDSKDWCSFWEIDKLDRPAPVDYKSDQNFWYNLPANFDVIDACYRIFQWTGDTSYISNPEFLNFYEKSLNDYIIRWDPDHDGLMESPEENSPRGIATYWEAGGPHAETGGDLLAAQFAAFKAYARILSYKGLTKEAIPYFHKADKLYKLFNYNWWYADKNRFYSSQLKGEEFDTTLIPAMQIFPLYWDIVDQNRKPSLFSDLREGVNVEENSYLAEVYYRNGFEDKAIIHLMNQLDPALKRREYPENSFTAIGTIVTQLIGLQSHATDKTIITRSGLPDGIHWVKMENIPVQGYLLDIMQVGQKETEISVSKSGLEPINWYGRFPGEHKYLEVNGRQRLGEIQSDNRGNPETQISLQIKPGQTIRVIVPKK